MIFYYKSTGQFFEKNSCFIKQSKLATSQQYLIF